MTTNPTNHNFVPPTGGNFELHERVRETIGKIAAQRIFFRLEHMPEEQRHLRMAELAKWFDNVFPRAVARVPNLSPAESTPQTLAPADVPDIQPPVPAVVEATDNSDENTQPTPETQASAPLLTLEELIEAVADEDTALSTLLLLDSDHYDQQMQLGTNMIGGLTDTYMRDAVQARKFVGDALYDKADYTALKRISDTEQGRQPQTVSMATKFTTGSDEANVRIYLALMLDAEKNVREATQTKQERSPAATASISSTELTPEKAATSKYPHLMDVLTGEAQIGAEDYERAASHMLEEAHDRKQLSRADVAHIKGRLFDFDSAGELSPDEIDLLKRLETALSSLNGKPSRIHENHQSTVEAVGYYKRFVHYSPQHGAASLSEMTNEANRNRRGGKVRAAMIVRKTLGVMQTVLEDTYNK